MEPTWIITPIATQLKDSWVEILWCGLMEAWEIIDIAS
jgi:hypothetical protein